MKRTIIAIAIFAALGLPARADSEAARLAYNNMSHEAVTCSAYFTVVAEALAKDGEKAAAAKYRKVATVAGRLAADMATLAKLKTETMTARYELAAKDMLARIDRDISNISILYADYGEVCKAVIEKPENRARYWFQKSSERLRR